MIQWTIFVFVSLMGFFLAVWILLKSRNMNVWISSYIRQKKLSSKDKRSVYVCLADHYEPYFGGVSQDQARELVNNWTVKYREVANRHSDSQGNPPQHTYFYPIEEYDEYVIDELKKLTQEGYGDVEIHLHHDDDTAENLEETLIDFKELLFEKHGLLRKDDSGNIAYGFIHGNWALDNSRPDGRWCGVNNEIDVLLRTNCVYDMTMPSAPSDTQTSTINSIYWAKDDGSPKSHDKGILASKGNWNDSDLLMVQGPLMLNWRNRKLGLIPRIESGELSGDAPPSLDRIKLWENAGISVKNQEDHIFIKIHTHGLQKANTEMFFDNNGFEILWTELESLYKNSDGYVLYYVTAWEMYKKISELIKD